MGAVEPSRGAAWCLLAARLLTTTSLPAHLRAAAAVPGDIQCQRGELEPAQQQGGVGGGFAPAPALCNPLQRHQQRQRAAPAFQPAAGAAAGCTREEGTGSVQPAVCAGCCNRLNAAWGDAGGKIAGRCPWEKGSWAALGSSSSCGLPSIAVGGWLKMVPCCLP